MAMTYPFQGVVYYEVEATYAAGFSGTQERISDAVMDARLDSGDINQTLMHIGDEKVADFSKTLVDPTLHLEWIWQPNADDEFEKDCTDRASCELDSLCIEVAANVGCGTATYYTCWGCICKTFTVSATRGDNYKCTADFSVASVQTEASAQGTDPGAIATEYAAFNTAGSVAWSGVTGAYVTDGFSVTVDNDLHDYWDVGSTTKKAAIPGAKKVTGSCDISLDDGGGTHWDEVVAGTDITSVIFNTGLTTGTCGKLTLSNGRFDSTSIPINTGGESMMGSVPFTFKDLAWAVGT